MVPVGGRGPVRQASSTAGNGPPTRGPWRGDAAAGREGPRGWPGRARAPCPATTSTERGLGVVDQDRGTLAPEAGGRGVRDVEGKDCGDPPQSVALAAALQDLEPGPRPLPPPPAATRAVFLPEASQVSAVARRATGPAARRRGGRDRTRASSRRSARNDRRDRSDRAVMGRSCESRDGCPGLARAESDCG